MFKGDGKGFPHPALVLSAVLASLVLPGPAVAAVITPSTTTDEFNSGGLCSLREAVSAAQSAIDGRGCVASGAYTGNDTIQLNPGTYTLTILASGADDLSTGDLDFSTQLTVDGLPGGAVTIDGFGADRIFACHSGSLSLHGLTLQGGLTYDPSPGSSQFGGAILASGCPLTVTDSTLTGNVADGGGAAIGGTGAISLTNVTISNNQSEESGGTAIWVLGGGSLALDHVTITDNHSLATGPGGVLVSLSGGMSGSVHNSIIAGNDQFSSLNDAPDCAGPISSTGGNVIGDTTGCDFAALPTDALNVPTMLGPLAPNGGTTQTHALLAGSPAIDHSVGLSPSTDQRGYARPFPAGGLCDSGAYEYGAGLDPAAALGCKPPPTPPAASQLANPACTTLRMRLKRARRAHNAAKVRKLRSKLRKLGC